MTVLEAKVHRASARNAKVAFWLALVTVWALTAAVASSYLDPILAMLLGVPTGLLVAGVVWSLVRIWPVLRLLWWWSFEIVAVVGLTYGWVQLATHTNLLVRLVVLATIAAPIAIGPARRYVMAWLWCVIVRHRLRVCFAQFIIANQAGSLPLIGPARPTPVGERVWIYLRPGLSHADLTSRLDKMAVACHASAVVVERASTRTAALLRVDIKRRTVLNAKVKSNLTVVVPDDFEPAERATVDVPTALDLPDVADPSATPKPAPAVKANLTSVKNGNGKPAPQSVPANGVPVENLEDWI
ncbi:hypothetical protein AB0J82_12670 [Asanoa sp. NPDC049518]|uniref:hypothetical protein n=1 Tax=unclassified Asanoa TaxID=2685164 RepID=UPI00342CAE79